MCDFTDCFKDQLLYKHVQLTRKLDKYISLTFSCCGLMDRFMAGLRVLHGGHHYMNLCYVVPACNGPGAIMSNVIPMNTQNQRNENGEIYSW